MVDLMDDKDIIWAAGLIDGEGCISICKQQTTPGRYSYSLRVQVCMVHKPTIEKLHNLFGGYLRVLRRKTKRNRTVWMWLVADNKARVCLEAIRPYSVSKLDEVKLAIAFESRTKHKGGRNPIDLATDIRETCYQTLRNLKKFEFPPNSELGAIQ